MKKSSALYRRRANLLYDVCGSIREITNAITAKTNEDSVNLLVYNEIGIIDGLVGAWVSDNIGDCKGHWDNITEISRENKDGHIIIHTQNYGVKGFDMYYFSTDELIHLHSQLEKIYKFIVKNK